VLLAGYDHFLRVAADLRWDERALDLHRDVQVWPRLTEAHSRRLLALLAGFCIGEAAVAKELEPFVLAASCAERSACFRAQAADEARHARFFDRVVVEVARVDGRNPGERRERLRALLEPSFLELFEERLPATASRLDAERDRLGDAVGLYHMLLEGLVFSAGQFAMLELLEAVDLPGLRGGLERVLDDEHWHLGFGARVLQDVGLDQAGVDRLLCEGVAALEAWGALLGDDLTERMLLLHRRRLRAAGLAAPRKAAALLDRPE
jgi:ribonucleoside-diphosphate reductase beta chain